MGRGKPTTPIRAVPPGRVRQAPPSEPRQAQSPRPGQHRAASQTHGSTPLVSVPQREKVPKAGLSPKPRHHNPQPGRAPSKECRDPPGPQVHTHVLHAHGHAHRCTHASYGHTGTRTVHTRVLRARAQVHTRVLRAHGHAHTWLPHSTTLNTQASSGLQASAEFPLHRNLPKCPRGSLLGPCSNVTSLMRTSLMLTHD